MSTTSASGRQQRIAQTWSPGLCETTFDGCLIEDVALAGGIVSMLIAGGIVRIWDAELGEFQLYSNTLAEIQLNYPGRGAIEILDRWRQQATPVSAEIRLWEQQVVVHVGCDAIAGTIPDHIYAEADPFL